MSPSSCELGGLENYCYLAGGVVVATQDAHFAPGIKVKPMWSSILSWPAKMAFSWSATVALQIDIVYIRCHNHLTDSRLERGVAYSR